MECTCLATKINLQEQKKAHQKRIDLYADKIRKHVDAYGFKDCDYLLNLRLSVHYHRGAYNTLCKLAKVNNG